MRPSFTNQDRFDLWHEWNACSLHNFLYNYNISNYTMVMGSMIVFFIYLLQYDIIDESYQYFLFVFHFRTLYCHLCVDFAVGLLCQVYYCVLQ
jgi:hypothetical protein